MLKIGIFSKLSRISIRMLRHYDQLGLLVPKSIDGLTGYRYYSEDQLPIAERISALKDMGFGLSAIGEIMRAYDNPQALRQFLAVQKAGLEEEAQAVGRRLQLLETAMNRLGKDELSMSFQVTCKELPARYVASVRKVIPAYNHEQILWNILMEETKHLHLQPDDPCYTLAVFHDGEYKESDVDIEVQKSVKGAYANTEHVVFKKVEPILMASATYTGSYEKLPAVNEAVANWVRDNGYEFNGLSFCIYHVSPYETSDPEKLVTEVCFPVKKK